MEKGRIPEAKAKRWAEAMFLGLVNVVDTLEEHVTPAIERVKRKGRLQQSLQEVYERLFYWACSARKLSSVTDYQAMAAVARSLLEMVTDIALLENEDAAHKFLAWTDSQKLKSSQATIAYEERTYGRIQRATEPLKDFVTKGEKQIQEWRRKYWTDSRGKPVHPERWTGPGRTLLEDVRGADSARGLGLERLYEEEYRRLCWNVHGSGVAATARTSLKFKYLYYGWAMAMVGNLLTVAVGLLTGKLELFKDASLAAHVFGTLERRWKDADSLVLAADVPSVPPA